MVRSCLLCYFLRKDSKEEVYLVPQSERNLEAAPCFENQIEERVSMIVKDEIFFKTRRQFLDAAGRKLSLSGCRTSREVQEIGSLQLKRAKNVRREDLVRERRKGKA